MLILYSGWFTSNLVHPRGEISGPGGETSFTSQWLLISAAWAILIIALIGAGFILYMGRSASEPREGRGGKAIIYTFVSPFMTGLLLLIAALHVKISLLERVAVSGDSMRPGLKSGRVLWVEKVSTGIKMPELDFPFGPIFKTGKLPAFGRGLPRRFDVVVIDYPGSGRKYLIKRVIGLPGDRFEFKDGRVRINGSYPREKYLNPGMVTRARPESYQPPIHGFPPRLALLDPVVRYSAMNGIGDSGVVPAHTILVLGDNRTHSRDSRSIGFIPLFFINGVVMGL